MNPSNATEVRRVRKEMSAEAGHDVRKLMEMLAPLREQYRDRIVNHGSSAVQHDVDLGDHSDSTAETVSLPSRP